jgi:integrase
VLLWTGLRPSEALALRWSDLMLDSDVRYLRVMRTLYRPKAARHAWAWEDTKTAQARSPVPLVGPVVEALARHRDRQAVERVLMGEGYVQHDLVFSDERGEPLHAEAVSKQFQRAIAKVNAARVEQAKAAGTEPTLLPTMRLYDARHTCATLLLEAGVAMRVVQGILRHSTMMLTANTYSHVRPVVVREAMTDFENFVQGTD